MPAKSRECAVIIKMTKQNRERLHAEAAELGITLQALAERRLLGIKNARPLPLGRQPHDRQDQELPLSG